MPPLLLNFDFNMGNFNNEKDVSTSFPFNTQSSLLKPKPNNNRTLSQALYKISQLNAMSNNNSGLLLMLM